MVDQLLHQQRHEQFPVEPCLGAVVVVLRHVPQLGQRLEALDHQFDLLAQGIPLQHVGGGKGGSGNVVKTITYSANRRVAGCTWLPLRAASELLHERKRQLSVRPCDHRLAKPAGI